MASLAKRHRRRFKPLKPKEITPEAVKLRLSHSLSRLVGPGRPHSFAETARLTNINERTLRAYVDGSACPNIARYDRLLRVLGPEAGRDLALMLGWTPRAEVSDTPDISALLDLRQDIESGACSG